jgi:hypothetical protein
MVSALLADAAEKLSDQLPSPALVAADVKASKLPRQARTASCFLDVLPEVRLRGEREAENAGGKPLYPSRFSGAAAIHRTRPYVPVSRL